MWIKICGLTTEDALAAALAARVDAIGFVLTDSVRQVNPVRARALAAPARGRVRCVAVMRAPSQALLEEALEVLQPDVLQADVRDLASLRVPAGLASLPVLRAGESLPKPLPARLLFEGPDSGAGVPTDWQQAGSLAGRTQLVLAGGLTPWTVGEAITRVRPFGVDVSSGVESKPGVKGPAHIMEFVAAARYAFARLAGAPGERKARQG